MGKTRPAVVNLERLGVVVDRNKTADDARREQELIVTLAVGYIEECTVEEATLLLADLSSAAWPTLAAQSQ